LLMARVVMLQLLNIVDNIKKIINNIDGLLTLFMPVKSFHRLISLWTGTMLHGNVSHFFRQHKTR